MRARPSSAHTRTWVDRSSSATAAGLGSSPPAAAGAYSAVRSSSACVVRTTNAFGTSCTRRQVSPHTENEVDVAWVDVPNALRADASVV